jgi:hypothetical protein
MGGAGSMHSSYYPGGGGGGNAIDDYLYGRRGAYG